VILVSSVEVEEVLLALKIGFLVLLYLFIWRIVRTASRDLRLPQESFIIGPDAARRGRRVDSQARLTVLSSPSLDPGAEEILNSAPVTVGRSSDNDLPLEGDDFASVRHARFEPRRDGVWVEDIGSTNGTFVNGIRVEEPRRLAPGDVVRIGETDLRFET
jgi:hypothetical protein